MSRYSGIAPFYLARKMAISWGVKPNQGAPPHADQTPSRGVLGKGPEVGIRETFVPNVLRAIDARLVQSRL